LKVSSSQTNRSFYFNVRSRNPGTSLFGSSKHLEDISTSLRNGFTSQRRKPPCLQHPEPTPIFGTSHPDFKLQIRPTSCSHDIFHTQRNMTQCRYLRKVRQASTYIQPGLQLSSCHHAQHVKACRRHNSLSTRDAIAITMILRQKGATTNLLGIATPSCDSVSITRCNYILLSVKPLTSTIRV